MAEFPVTLANLVSRVVRLLEDAPTTDILAADALSTDTTITVTNGTLYSKDTRLEIDNEVMYLSDVPTGNTLPVVRGYEGTTAASHNGSSAPATIRRDPRFLRTNIIEAINVVLGDWCSFWFPKLVWDGTTGGSFSPIKWIVDSPADAYQLIWAGIQFPGGYKRLQAVAHGPLETFPTTSPFPSTGKGFRLLQDDWIAGYTIWALYGKLWANLVSDADTTDADFPPEADDLIVTGALLYLVGLRHVPRFRMTEIAYIKEMNATVPSVQNLQQLQFMAQEWAARAHQVRTRRPTPITPEKVWRA